MKNRKISDNSFLHRHSLLVFNILLAVMMILGVMYLFAGCGDMSCSYKQGREEGLIGDDTEQFRNISVLLKQFNNSLILHGSVKDTTAMKKDYEIIMNLEQNRLLLIKKVFEENGNKVVDEIIVDKTGVRWNDEIIWHQGDTVANIKYGIGVVVSKGVEIAGEKVVVKVVFDINKIIAINPWAITKADNNLLSKRVSQYADAVIDEINKGVKK